MSRVFLDVRNAMYGKDTSSLGFLDKTQYLVATQDVDNTLPNAPHMIIDGKDRLLLSADFELKIYQEYVSSNTYAFYLELIPHCNTEDVVYGPDILNCITFASMTGYYYWVSYDDKGNATGHNDPYTLTMNVSEVTRLPDENKYHIGTWNIGRDWSWFNNGLSYSFSFGDPIKEQQNVNNTLRYITISAVEEAPNE